VNTITGIVAEQLTNQINNLLFKLFKDNKLKVNLSSSFYYNNLNLNPGSTSSLLEVYRNNVNIAISKSYLDGRLNVYIDRDFDFGLSSGQQLRYNGNFIANWRIEFLITPDGKIRTSLFQQNTADAAAGNITRTRSGGSFAYRLDFNNFFRKNPKKKNGITPPKENAVLPNPGNEQKNKNDKEKKQ
jgi:TamB, inner membrane protein subunit of TAM complex